MNTKLFSEIESLVPTLPGWATVQKAQTLAAIVTAIRPKSVWEIGVYAGRSALPMAMALQSNGTGKLFAVDAWSSSASIKGQTEEHVRYWSDTQIHSDAKLRFEAMIAALALTDYVEVIQKDSNTILPAEEIQVLHIDGNHSAQSVADASRFAHMVPIGGFCILDDLTWKGADGQGPEDAAEVLEDLGFEERFRVITKPEGQDDWAVFQRTKV